MTPEAVRMLIEYSWPGNLRELSNVADRMSLLCDGQLISETEVRSALFVGGVREEKKEEAQAAFLSSRQITHEMALEALCRHDGNRTATAKALGISTTTLWRKLREDVKN